MSAIPLKSQDGADQGTYEIPDELLIHGKGGAAAHQAVIAYRANQRAGTASTLTRSEVQGGGGKPWKQKGTGRARAGSRRSPLWRGGGVAFGPKPRSYRKKLTKKEMRLAFRRMFSEKISAGNVLVLDEISMTEPSTKAFNGMLKRWDLSSTPALLILATEDKNIALSARNIPDVDVTNASSVNTYQLLRYPQLVITKSGMQKMEARLRARVGRGA